MHIQTLKTIATKGEYSSNLYFQSLSCKKGLFFLASSEIGLCALFPSKDLNHSLKNLQSRFPKAKILPVILNSEIDIQQQKALIFLENPSLDLPLVLHLLGTQFQLQVWEALLTIKPLHFESYQSIAQQIKRPKAYRAVGTAVGKNPIGVLIPCHRVIKSNGELGNYHWGEKMKKSLLDWENQFYRNTLV
ncbi:MAG: hypothetical protein C4K58_03890 [Flavobacteriaceae bacterium]|nr:MAG: hypothetical protein C4K58_03890 [Flavobacteriaceae bacterium]